MHDYLTLRTILLNSSEVAIWADLDALLNGHSLSNRRMVFEKMGSALLPILYTFEDEYRDMIQLLAIVLGNTAPIPESFDRSTKL